jgi:hypothetical protein
VNFRIENRLFTFYIGINRVEMVDGVNSHLPDGDHILLWDFDDVPIGLVLVCLKAIQEQHNLPNIYIIPTGRPNCYHANCFKRFSWLKTRTIIANTPFVDKKFLAIGILRGFFTLRYTPTGETEFGEAIVLPSEVESDIDPMELTSFSTYPKKVRSGLFHSLFTAIAKKQTRNGR